MRHITPAHMAGFNSELEKAAGIGQGARWLGQKLFKGYGRRIATTSALGAAGGAATAEPGSRVQGAMGGAMAGAALGGGSVLATRAGRRATGIGLRNFGKRQIYSVTGKGIKTHKDAIKYGLIKQPGKDLKGKALTKALREKALKQEAFNKGYLHAPGIVRGAVKNPGDLLRSGWKRSDTLGKGFVGLGAYQTAKGVTETPTPGGPGRLQKGLEGLGQTAGWLVAPQTILGGSLVGIGAGVAGQKAGALAERAYRRAPRGGK